MTDSEANNRENGINSDKLRSELNSMNNKEQNKILDWALKVKSIREDRSLSNKDKFKALYYNYSTLPNGVMPLLILKYATDEWKKASWSKRLLYTGAGLGIAIIGNGGAGIATMGTAISIPFFLLTGAGGAAIGTIIDSLTKKN